MIKSLDLSQDTATDYWLGFIVLQSASCTLSTMDQILMRPCIIDVKFEPIKDVCVKTLMMFKIRRLHVETLLGQGIRNKTCDK